MLVFGKDRENPNRSVQNCVSGGGFIDSLIDKIPVELHIPGYQYCGPGTNLKKRLARGDPGINQLDAACKQHDISYNTHKDSNMRARADEVLQNEALNRAIAQDSSFGERANALAVAAAMKAKRTISGHGIVGKETQLVGLGIGRKNIKMKNTMTFASLIKNGKTAIKREKPDTIESAIKVAVRSIKKAKQGNEIKTPRTIKMPLISGGILPLIPIFAGLGALGSIVGSTAGVVGAINQTKQAQQELAESKRHNAAIEAIAIGKKRGGKGFYLRPSKRGDGFYLSPYSKNR